MLSLQPISGGPVEQYISLLEDRVTSAEARMEEMRQDHAAEIEELEAEFEVCMVIWTKFPMIDLDAEVLHMYDHEDKESHDRF